MSALLFIGGSFSGIILYFAVILSFLHLLRARSLVAQGVIQKAAIVFFLKGIGIWGTLLFLVPFLLSSYMPDEGDPLFVGQFIGVIIGVMAMTAKGKLSFSTALRNDFWHHIEQEHFAMEGTGTGAHDHIVLPNSHSEPASLSSKASLSGPTSGPRKALLVALYLVLLLLTFASWAVVESESWVWALMIFVVGNVLLVLFQLLSEKEPLSLTETVVGLFRFALSLVVLAGIPLSGYLWVKLLSPNVETTLPSILSIAVRLLIFIPTWLFSIVLVVIVASYIGGWDPSDWSS